MHDVEESNAINTHADLTYGQTSLLPPLSWTALVEGHQEFHVLVVVRSRPSEKD